MKRYMTLGAVVLMLTAVSAALAAGGPGKFKTTLTGKSAKTLNGELDGTWMINLSSATSGKIGLSRDGHATGGGTYVISGSTITLTPKKGGTCTTKGKYTFKQTAAKITFKVKRDSCAVRRAVLTFGAWTKVG